MNELLGQVAANNDIPNQKHFEEIEKTYKTCLSVKQELTNLELILSEQLKVRLYS